MLQREDTWILGEVVLKGTAWHLHTVVRANGTRDRRCLLITPLAHDYHLRCVDVRSTPHLLYLDEIAHTHFAVTRENLASLPCVGQVTVEHQEAAG